MQAHLQPSVLCLDISHCLFKLMQAFVAPLAGNLSLKLGVLHYQHLVLLCQRPANTKNTSSRLYLQLSILGSSLKLIYLSE